jgi:hypothetical protein
VFAKSVSVFAENVFVFARRCLKGLLDVGRGLAGLRWPRLTSILTTTRKATK